ncbi:hypothetical protein D4764_10G0010090 [Takifugu flavidus]|uniref:C-type lectin domain-containing protein n=3 Tax=Takifugu flavidus TaxID=433684 RepID=A0A5C6PM24_9TELE|nr:hypothetical protein D4764_10G0010090 [Takifugu flavidus]
MDRCVILMLFTSGFGFSCSSHLSLRTYHIISKGLTWEGAQQYCRENFQDLATFESMDDVNSITELYDWSWIGLHEYSKSWKTMSKDINSWRWSLTGEGSRTGYYKWRDSEPDNHMLMEHCVGMKPGGYWFDDSCQREKRFVCYDVVEGKNAYVYVSEVKSWYSALTYCRQHHIGFPVIENSDQQKLVHSAIPSYSDAPIWLGLYRVPWVWSDGSQSSYRNFSSSKSENYKDEKLCVSAKSNSEWSDFNCSSVRPFICQQVSELTTLVSLRMESSADLSDSTINQQLLHQLGAALLRLGWTNVHLQWKSGPSQQQSLTSPEYSPSC